MKLPRIDYGYWAFTALCFGLAAFFVMVALDAGKMAESAVLP